MSKPYCYCEKCKKRVERIIEVYPIPLEETREWNGSEYEVVVSNADLIEPKTLCGICYREVKFLEDDK